MKDKIYAVYLRKNSEGSFTFIDGKRYFIDRTCTELQNKEGICFVSVTKDKGNYGFVSGSFTCPVESVSIEKYKDLLDLDREDYKVYTYGGCIFVEKDDCLSIGHSVYVWFEGEVEPRRITSSEDKGYYYNKSLLSYLHYKGVNITNEIMLEVGVVSISSVPFNEVAKLVIRVSSDISNVSVLEDKIVVIKYNIVEDIFGELYFVFTEDGENRRVNSLTSTKYSKGEIKDITSDLLAFAKEHYICKRGYSYESTINCTSTFMGANLSVLLMDRYNYSDEAWEENKDKIIKSAEEYSQRVSALRKYVTVKTAKDYKAILLDSLIWK